MEERGWDTERGTDAYGPVPCRRCCDQAHSSRVTKIPGRFEIKGCPLVICSERDKIELPAIGIALEEYSTVGSFSREPKVRYGHIGRKSKRRTRDSPGRSFPRS